MKLNIWRLEALDADERARIMARSEADIADMRDVVAPIIADVKARGDAALIDYARKFEGAEIVPGAIKASEEEFARAEKRLEPEIKAAIERCAGNVRRFHEAQMAREERLWLAEIAPGIHAGEQLSPLPSIGIYVPRGKGAFPSVMYMLCTPAVVAGVPEVAVVTPPTADGSVDDASLFAARVCGVRNVYKCGGAQAVAALAHGTETVPRVVKMVGPGNAYVAAARRMLADRMDPGMPAGPSEALVLADDSADAHNTALDLLNEAEHGPDSASILVTPSERLASDVAAALPALVDALPEKRADFCRQVLSGYGGIMIAPDMDAAIGFCNDYAVEHLHLKVAEPDAVLSRLLHVGEVLVGEATPIVAGNFGIGVNAVLPTGGHARTFSATGVHDFLKRTTVASMTPDGMASLRDDVVRLAEYEGFAGHARVLTERRNVAAGSPPLKG